MRKMLLLNFMSRVISLWQDKDGTMIIQGTAGR